jgi:hypothetical protein
VKKVTDIVAEIAMASKEQSAGIEQVNKAVMHLDELTQQNAALVEEASAASQAMAEQARGLNGAMQRYKVNAVSPGAMVNADTSAPQASEAAQASERRKPSRPWSGKRAAAPEQAPVAARRVANDADDSVWKEF